MTAANKINLVMADLASEGIGKDQTNKFDKYQFRGIDDVYNVLSRILSKHGLVYSIETLSHGVETVQTSQNKSTRHATVLVKYVFVDADDETGMSVIVTIAGEAQDRGDKALNKAYSAAFKLMAFQLFCIPTQGDGKDSEEESVVYEEPVVVLTEEQLGIVKGWLHTTNTELDAFLEWQGFGALELIPASRFDQIVKALDRKQVRMSEAYAQAEQESNQAQEAKA
jgi:hypothetical protein